MEWALSSIIDARRVGAPDQGEGGVPFGPIMEIMEQARAPSGCSSLPFRASPRQLARELRACQCVQLIGHRLTRTTRFQVHSRKKA